MKIYTKTGDQGTTSLFGGKRISKDSQRVATCGEVDELNSLLGVIIAECELSLRGENRRSNLNSTASPQNNLKKIATSRLTGLAMTLNKLVRIQGELFVLGTDLATPKEVKVKVARVKKNFVQRLEREIDAWEKELPVLRNFILPGGSAVGSKLHLARTVARRAERSIVDLSNAEKINVNALIYINRLSDWLFVLARYINNEENAKEIIWTGRGK